jgi:hypothetical protein
MTCRGALVRYHRNTLFEHQSSYFSFNFTPSLDCRIRDIYPAEAKIKPLEQSSKSKPSYKTLNRTHSEVVQMGMQRLSPHEAAACVHVDEVRGCHWVGRYNKT